MSDQIQQPQNLSNYPGNYSVPRKEQITALRKNEFEKIIPNKSSGRSWSALQIRPKATFATQNVGEEIYVLSRKHWIVNIGWITRNFLYSLIPPVAAFLIQLLQIQVPTGSVAERIYAIAIFAFYSIILTNVIRDFFDWYFDPYIVTNERILDFTFNPFTNYSVAEASLEDIESVKQNTKGILGAIFNYGDIKIETAATQQTILFEAAPNPNKVRDILADLSKVAKTYSYGD